MALSEYEQRRLDEIERALHRDDPHFAGAINIGAILRHRRLVVAAVGVIGLLALGAGAVLAQGLPVVGVAVSVLGFVAMVAGAWLFLPGRPGSQRNAGDTAADPARTRWSRREERFRRRFDQPDH